MLTFSYIWGKYKNLLDMGLFVLLIWLAAVLVGLFCGFRVGVKECKW